MNERKVRLSLFSRNMARGMGTMTGYAIAFLGTLAVYRWLGLWPEWFTRIWP